jgi:hypothetical protein
MGMWRRRRLGRFDGRIGRRSGKGVVELPLWSGVLLLLFE